MAGRKTIPMVKKITWLLSFVVMANVKAGAQQKISVGLLSRQVQKLYPLHQKKQPPEFDYWLEVHAEPGQTFEAYMAARPIRPGRQYNAIYIQPIAHFTAGQQKLLDISREYIGLYLNLPVKVLPALPLSIIPESAQRTHPSRGTRQILSTFMLDSLLTPRRPDDALALLGLTTVDLWTELGLDFISGQASFHNRVGVCSLYWSGDPDGSDSLFTLCLSRTIKTAVHEIGHILTMRHCSEFDCVMNGGRYLKKWDDRPLYLCPICLKKLCWNLGMDPVERYQKLATFCLQHNLLKEAEFFQKSFQIISDTAADHNQGG